ncbi:MAG: hypothetical protein U1E95_07880 [Rubrivivax sp.]
MGMTLVNSADWLAHKGTVGRAVVGVLKICDDEGRGTARRARRCTSPTARPSSTGTTRPRRPPAATRRAGPLGDIGYVDAEGFLYLSDRKAFMIISGSVNVYPQEAENLLVTHPKVLDVAVFGVPNEEFGEEVKAVVQPRELAEAGPALETS